MRVSVASYYTWENGYCYGSVHIGTRTQSASIPDGFHWWSQGTLIKESGQLVPGTPRDLADFWITMQLGVIRATSRDIREPVAPSMRRRLLDGQVPNSDREARKRRIEYYLDAYNRVVAKYGATSEQAKMIASTPVDVADSVVDAEGESPGADPAAGRGSSRFYKAEGRMWAPSWTQIMSLPRSDR